MGTTTRRKEYGGEFKARVAVAAIKGEKTINEISSAYGIHPSQIMKWKKQVLEEMPHIFSIRRSEAAKTSEEEKAILYQEIGQLKVELDWLKKKSGL